MKAVRYHRYGDSAVLKYEDVARPAPAPGEVLIKVAATSFNPVDAAIRAGYLAEVFPLELPHVPGVDVAGTVAETGADDWRVGDAVVAFLPVTADGAAAEYVLAPASVLAAAPKSVALADAAALPAVGLTAWQALFDDGELTAGQTILVNGAGGAVGGYAVQLAKRAGAHVTATAGPRSAQRLHGYGADAVIGHLGEETVSGAPFDVVLNLVATTPEQTAALTGLVADGGVVVSATTPAVADETRGVRAVQVSARSDAERLTHLVELVDAGQLRIDIAGRRPLSELGTVHAEAAAGTLAGRTILIPA